MKTVLALSWQSSPQQNISMLTNLQAIPPPPPLSSTHPTIPFICLLICYVVYFPSICNGELFGFMYEFNFLCFCLFVCLWIINVIIIIIIIIIIQCLPFLNFVPLLVQPSLPFLSQWYSYTMPTIS